jgi:cyanophycinase
MGKSKSTFIAIGGGELADADSIVDRLVEALKDRPNGRILVLTVATNEPEAAAEKYNSLFRSRGVKHVDTLDISERKHALSKRAISKVERADALFFTGGDQLNITTLLGGSPLGDAITKKTLDGVIVAGTSAGAAMMSKWMIISGDSDKAPNVGGVEIAPGMDLFDSMIIDTHFSQRGRHGRLLAAIAHFPQAIGVGLDERTAVFIKGNKLRIVGDGVVTIMDGSSVTINDLPYRGEGEKVGLAGVTVDVLPDGYQYDIKKRTAIAPPLKKIRFTSDDV